MHNTENKKLAHMYDMARSAKECGDAITAKKYYDMILEEDPLNWEPTFYSVYFTYSTMKNGEIGNKACEIKNCLNTILLMVNKIDDIEEKNNILFDLKKSISTVGNILHASSISFYNSLPLMAANPDAKTARTILIGDLLFTMGDALRQHNLSKEAIDLYKQAIKTLEDETAFYIYVKTVEQRYQPTLNKIKDVADYIRQTEPDFVTKREQNEANLANKKGGCYVATCVYGSYDCPEVWTLRRFRDNTLGSTWYGRAFIHVYYAISPTIVKWFGNTAWFKKMWKGTLDRMVKNLEASGVENTPYEDKKW